VRTVFGAEDVRDESSRCEVIIVGNGYMRFLIGLACACAVH
jgi:hypothetical protein